MDLHLKDKVVIVTGAASGIGAASALAFAREGAKVVVADIHQEAGQKVVAQIRDEKAEAIFIRCDVSSENDVKNLIAKTVEKFGRIDCAFNNAGIEGETQDTLSCTNENWQRTLDINLKGIWLCMKYEIPEMLKAGGGAIVNCSSIAGVVGFEGLPAYVASKHGVVGLTQTAALEYATKNVRVNAICPGVIDTPMVGRITHGQDSERKMFIEGEPVHRMGKPEEIASAAVWLCSDASSFITGHPLVADGGWVAR